MPTFTKPAAGSWTQNYHELGTVPVDFTDSIDPDFDLGKNKLGLKTVRCEIWEGFVFINLDDDAQPLESYPGPRTVVPVLLRAGFGQ